MAIPGQGRLDGDPDHRSDHAGAERVLCAEIFGRALYLQLADVVSCLYRELLIHSRRVWHRVDDNFEFLVGRLVDHTLYDGLLYRAIIHPAE